MNAEIKQKWAAALRSGEYKQAEGNLRNEDGGFCCLGVLCDILAPEKWNADRPHRHGCDEGIPGHEILERAEFGSNVAFELAEMNDGGATFTEIADYIEREL